MKVQIKQTVVDLREWYINQGSYISSIERDSQQAVEARAKEIDSMELDDGTNPWNIMMAYLHDAAMLDGLDNMIDINLANEIISSLTEKELNYYIETGELEFEDVEQE